MTPAELKTARTWLGLKASELGRALELEGRDPGQQISRWEKGAATIPGPAAVAVRYMLDERARKAAQEAQEAAQAVVFTDPQGPDLRPLHERVVTTRRRGA